MAKNKIVDIYEDYFQKSKVFLHPALGIKKGMSIDPIETYFSWEGEVKITDNKLVCLHHIRDDDEFIAYEERYLLNNPLFEVFIEVEDNKAIYIFDFEEYAEDFKAVIEGRYSQISQRLKDKIKHVYGKASNNYAYIKSYLYPEYYIEDYARLLSPQEKYVEEMEGILMDVGELCSKPDLKKENLEILVKALKL